MKKIGMYLDEAISSGVAKNSSELAAKLGVSRSALSEWRAERSHPNDDQAVKLASLLQKDPGELLAECGAARAKTPATRQAWERIAARMAGLSITVLAMIIPLSYIEEGSDCGDTVCFYFQKLKSKILSMACKMVPCL